MVGKSWGDLEKYKCKLENRFNTLFNRLIISKGGVDKFEK